ncbi:hypothetical protein [Janthinobacterium agaricidamnosum]|uniref:Fimbrial assembly family protein n=1 Tax=Janthinobacterium agaricidamnosum NBRC 102515 = DSM 9628 TaxID=1349767 RepID=W0V334_9BURK|nr:hypothetical protein [Janthinobacterium agaricidamnosum]CDG81985.1 hypothetical protein GJA_1332 [Janthinobacterium agaricidamnosum NBRC 102515 = DSM 9628]
MSKLRLEFIERRQVPWAGLVFLAAALLCGVSVALEWRDLQAGRMVLQERSGKLEKSLKERQRSALQEQKKADPAAELRLKERQKVIASLNYSWNRILSPLEQTESNEVAILSFVHDQSVGGAQLTVEALDFPALSRFVDKMNQDADGRRWYVANYQTQAPGSPATIKATVLNQ